jgi:predicted nucleic acid-binding protein
MPRLFLDTNVVVRFVEGTAEMRDALQRRLSGVRSGADGIVTSELVRFECLVGPRRLGDRGVESLYERFFSALENEVRPLDRPVFDLAVGIRAQHRFSTPDALHLATAGENLAEVRESDRGGRGRARPGASPMPRKSVDLPPFGSGAAHDRPVADSRARLQQTAAA